ncbi:MAG: electron transport complex protein RnfG [Firmicutes bacterium ADurb.Bin456]|nr:MAG: electron transport complex protein RnfG [Firmicutes bacterium ADurb.Bin456]
MPRPVVLLLVTVIITFVLTGCFSGNSNKLTAQQREALQGLLDNGQNINDLTIQGLELPEKIAKKFPAVKKAFEITCDGHKLYAFHSRPLGYRSAIDLFTVIDSGKNETLGTRVLQHDETPLYGGESLDKEWFLNRFKNKSIAYYLNRVSLEQTQPNDVIQITCATISSQAVINGVNAAIGAYRELILGEEAQPVSLKVEGFVTEIK